VIDLSTMSNGSTTFSGLTKLIFPAGVMEKEDARMLLRLAIELRLRVLVQLHTMNEQEFHVTELSFRDRGSGEVEVVRVVV
jgi:ATP-dependent Lon protease